MQNNQTGLLSHSIHRNKKWIKDLNVKPEAIKISEENIGSTLFDIGLSIFFFVYVSSGKGKKAKINK